MKQKNTIFVRKNFVYVYYGILLLILTSWTNTESAPPMIFRLVFLALTIVPAFYRAESLSAVLTCFTSIAFYGYSDSYMPTMLYIYAGLVLVLSWFVKVRSHMKIPNVLVLFTIYVTLINFITASGVQDISYSFFIFIMMYLMVGRQDDDFFNRMSFAFAIITFVLSIFYLTSTNEYAVQYASKAEGLERYGWTDSNYFGTVIGIGTVFSVLRLFRDKEISRLLKIFHIVVIVISLMTLALNASRGAVVSVVGALVVCMLFTKIKVIYKIMLLIVGIGFLFFLYNSGYMDVLIYRAMEDTATTAGGRTGIWIGKLDYWMRGGFFSLFFGKGQVGGLNISGNLVGFHNDFLAALVNYGIVGFIIYLWVVFLPLFKVYQTKSPNTIVVFTLVVYLILTSFSLEPVTAGRLPYVMLLFAIYILANQNVNGVGERI